MNDEKQLSVHAFVVPVTPFQQNCSIIWCTETKKGAVIDPGGDIEEILNAIKKYDISIEKIPLSLTGMIKLPSGFEMVPSITSFPFFKIIVAYSIGVPLL